MTRRSDLQGTRRLLSARAFFNLEGPLGTSEEEMVRVMVARIIASSICVAIAVTAPADTVHFVPFKDNSIYRDRQTSANGAGNGLFAGNNAIQTSATRRALLSFNLADVPPGSIVNSASLTLFLAQENTGRSPISGSAHRLLVDWGEGSSSGFGSGSPATPGDATWNDRFFNTQPWATAGGDFLPGSSAETLVGTENQFYTWSSSGLAADVQLWIDAPQSNVGWILIGDESEVRTAKRFDSRESTILTHRPTLTIDFTPPPMPGACCVGSACLVITSQSCISGGGRFVGTGIACNPASNTTHPCCRADFDQNGSLAVSDIFTYLAAWFSSESCSDINNDGALTVADIFDFLAAWFAGC